MKKAKTPKRAPSKRPTQPGNAEKLYRDRVARAQELLTEATAALQQAIVSIPQTDNFKHLANGCVHALNTIGDASRWVSSITPINPIS